MILIVGLGNPGRKFQKTRHNIGFQIVDHFSRKNNFPKFRLKKEFQALISEGKFNNQKIILAKPQTFINLSGKSLKSLTKTYNLKPKNLIIIHDDIDLPLGKVRISIGRGSAGHKGVQSIIEDLKTKNFLRLRIGISPENKPKNVKKFVLEKFNKEEERKLKKIFEKSCLAIEEILRKD